MKTSRVYLEGVEFWSPATPGWNHARPALAGLCDGAQTLARRPSPEWLPPAERRRAPDTVALALEVARAVLDRSGRRADALLSVFTSAHGDMAITDAICATLANSPRLMSPTKFHHSVHNAASGYWGIATGSMRSSISVSAFDCSFAAGLLEALMQCAAESMPVLLVGYDIAACGPLASTNDSEGMLGAALVVAPAPTGRAVCGLDWSLHPGDCTRRPARSSAGMSLARNAMADAVPLFEAIAREEREELLMPLSPLLSLAVRLSASA
jgi:hypothetical protein